MKEKLNELLKAHEQLQAAKRGIEEAEKTLIQITTSMKLGKNRTYKYIHEGQLVIINVKELDALPQISIPEVINTEYENSSNAPTPAVPRAYEFDF